jgi:serine/threonine-protein kinase
MIAEETRLGPYEIISFLAAGGMGEVYRGHDARLGRAVAIKVLPEAAFSDSEAVLRFEREARAAAAMSHPNLIAIHDVGRAGDLHYLVMDLLEGETLRQRLDGGALPWPKAVELAVSVAAGIAAVHAKGFVHRDLKPENIFLTADGWVKLLDFGLAVPPRRASGPMAADDPTMRAVTRKGFLVGTLAYMSPEQLREEEIDGRADLFALGCVLYEMLAGQSPFLRDSRAETCAAILSDRPVVLPPSVPAPVANVVQRCLQRDRERRYSSASEAMAALRRVDAGKWVSGPRQACPEQSIAVLPFTNLSGEKENDYFGDGLAEEIRNSLTSVPGLKVTARTSALAFRGKEIDVRMIGQTLGVRAILQGSVRRVGNQVRVTAQLVDTANGYHLWSARFDRAMTDVFAVQDEIAAAMADTLKLRLGGEGAQRARRTNVDAYHAYLKSRYHFSKLTPERLALSRAYAEEAIDADPDYPAAQAQLAECFIQTALYGMSSPREMMPLARDAALKAVAGDAGEASAQLALARIAGEYDHDWTEALRRCRLALASERILPAVRALCAQYILWPLGRLDELTEAIRPALEADPLSPMPRTVYAHALATGGAIDRSLDEMRAVLELHEQFWPGYFAVGFLLTVMKRTSEAITAFEKSLRIAPWNAAAAGLLEGNLIRAGLRDRVDAILAELNVSGRARRAPLALTSMHFAAGQYDRAAEHFARVIDERYPVAAHHLTWLCVDNVFRTSPAGRALRERMKLGS